MPNDYLEKAVEAAQATNIANLIDRAKFYAMIAIAQELRLIRQQLGSLMGKGRRPDVHVGK